MCAPAMKESLRVLCRGTSGTTFPTVGAAVLQNGRMISAPTVGTANFIQNNVGAHLCVRPVFCCRGLGFGKNPQKRPGKTMK